MDFFVDHGQNLRHRFARLMLACLVVAWCPALQAADAVPMAGLRTLIVPADQPQSWPQAEWEIVERDEFDRVLRANTAEKTQDDSARITAAQYEASFVDNMLQGGRFHAEVITSSASDSLLPMDSFGLATTNLFWQNSVLVSPETSVKSPKEQEAILGRIRTGGLRLIVPRAEEGVQSRTLVGSWSLAGHVSEDSVSFEVRLLPAITNSLTLTLPSDHKPIASTGVVTRISQPNADAGTSRWRIDLSHANRLELRIQRISQEVARSYIVAEREMSWVLQPTEAQIQARFDVSVSDRSVTSLEFLVPDSVQLYAVTYGGESVLSWRVASMANQRGQRVSVELPEPLIGTGRPLRLSGLTTLSAMTDRPMPTIELENSALLASRTNLAISNQLEIERLEADGFRQTKTANTPSGQSTFAFEQMQQNAEIRVQLSSPEPKPSVRVVSWLDTRSSHWRLKSQATISTHAGQTFAVVCRLSNEWEPTDIRSLSGAKVAHWELGDMTGGERRIHIEFREAVTPDSPMELLIQARRLPTSITRQIRLPLLRAEDAAAWSSVVGVTSEMDQEPRLVSSEPANVRITKPQLPTYANTPLFEDAYKSAADIQLFHFRTPTDHADLLWEHTDAAFTATAKVQADIHGRELREQMLIAVDPAQSLMTGIDLALRSPASDWSWQLLQNDQVIRTLDPTRHAHIPSAHGRDRYHFRFDPPVSGEFQIIGTGSSTFAEDATVELPLLPNAREFSGNVELQWPSKGGRVVAEQVREIPAIDTQDETQDHVVRRLWAYDESASRLTIHFPPKSAAGNRSSLAELNVASVCSLGATGWDRHRAVYQFYNPRGGEPQRFRLPDDARLETVLVDDTNQAVTKIGQDYELPFSNIQGMRSLEIRYLIPSHASRFRAKVMATLPTIDVKVMRSTWDVTTPSDWELSGGGTPSKFETRNLPTISQQFFGPLGLRQNETIFNPFSWTDWQSLRDGQGENDGDARRSRSLDPASPPDWITRQFTSIHTESPEPLEFVQRPALVLLQWWLLIFFCLTGLTIRAFRRSGMSWLFVICFSFGISGSWILPAVYAPCCGAITSGLILATLLPIGWLLRSSRRTDSSEFDVEVGSTATIQRSSLILRLILVATAYGLVQAFEATTITAAEPQKPGPQDVQILPQEWDVLFPQSEQGDPLDYVYVRKSLWADWVKPRPIDEPPRYLLTRSDFAIESTNEAVLNIVAKLTVVPFDNDGCLVTIPLPRTRLAARADCLLDGEPCFPTTNPKTGALEVEIPRRISSGPAIAESSRFNASTRLGTAPHEIRLRLRAPNLIDATQGSLELKLLRIPETNVSIAFTKPVASIAMDTAGGTWMSQSSTDTVNWNLGPAESVELSWNSSSAITGIQNRRKLTARGIVTAHPLRTQHDWNLAIQWENEAESSCVVWLPQQAKVESITEAGLASVSDEVIKQRRRIRLEFTSPPKTKASIGLKYSLPAKVDEKYRTILRDDFPLLRPDSPDTSETDYAIGVAPVTGYDFVPRPMESAPPTKLLPERFLSEFNAESAPTGKRVPPEAIYHMDPNSRVEFQLVPKQPRRQVRLEQAGRLRDRELLWDVSGEISLTNAAAYRHMLHVPRELRIDSISVLEDETERLARWSRSGESITLYLSNGSTGKQRLQIRGHQTIYPDTEHAFPVVSVLNARHEDTTIRLFSDPSLDVRINDSAHSGETKTLTGGESENGLRFLAELTWTHQPIEPNMGDEGPSVPKFRYSDRPLEVQVDLATSAAVADSTDRLAVQWLMRLVNNDCAARPFAFTLPPDVMLENAFSSDGEMVAELEQEDHEVGSKTFHLADSLSPGEMAYVLLEGTIPKPSQTTVELPQPQLVGGEFFSRVVAIASPLLMAETEIDRLTSPNWLETLPDLEFPADRELLELSGGQKPTVAVASVDLRRGIPPIVETEIHWLGNRTISAKTLVVVPSGPSTTLDFSWPEHAEPVGVLFDDLIALPAEIQENQLSIDLPSSSTTRILEIVWHQTIPQRVGSISDSLGEANWSIPRLVSSSAESQGVTLFAGDAVRLIPARPTSLDEAEMSELSESFGELLSDAPQADGKTVRRIHQLLMFREDMQTESSSAERGLVASWVIAPERPLPRVWVLQKTTERLVLGSLLFLVLAAACGLGLMARRQWILPSKLMLVLLGLVWWACFRWSYIGLVILVIAGVLVFWKDKSDESTLEVPSVRY